MLVWALLRSNKLPRDRGALASDWWGLWVFFQVFFSPSQGRTVRLAEGLFGAWHIAPLITGNAEFVCLVLPADALHADIPAALLLCAPSFMVLLGFVGRPTVKGLVLHYADVCRALDSQNLD